MSVEDKRSDESDYCPDCKGLLEIAAINLTLSGRNVALFVCLNCGLARAETRNAARSKLRHRISALERMLWELKYWVQRLGFAATLVHRQQRARRMARCVSSLRDAGARPRSTSLRRRRR
jgi:hypothetical protein